MAEFQQINSILAVDVGSVNTRAVLIDLVDGKYRLVMRGETRSTADDPWRDAGVGLRRALKAMTERTGRRFLTAEDEVLMPERASGYGVDQFVATASAGRPLRVLLAGLMPDVSIASGLHALSGSYVEVVDTLSLADIRTEEQQINDILNKKPDLIFIVGGTDAGAEEAILKLVRVVRTAVRLVEGATQPTVLYAGNRAVQRRVSELMESEADLYLAANVRPRLLEEKLDGARHELAAVYDHFKVNHPGGFGEISQRSLVGILPTAHSFANIVRYLGETDSGGHGGILAVDVGSATTTLVASTHRQPHISIRNDLGVGHSATGILAATTPDDIRRWLTWNASDADIANYAHNKTLRPATIPQTAQDLELEYALAREAIRVAVEGTRAVRRLWQGDRLANLGTVIGSGAVLAKGPHAGMAALILLDALPLTGVIEVWLDSVGLLPALGAVAYAQPAAVVQVLDEGDLLFVGTAICAEGRVRLGRGGMDIRVTLDNGQVERHQVRGGTLWTYPLPPGQTARVEVRLSRGLSVGGRSRLKLTLKGGAAGLIFDARGRPLPLPRKAEARARLYPHWVAGTKGRVRLRVDELAVSEVDAKAIAEAEAAPEEPLAAAEGVALEEAADEAPAPKPRRFRLLGRRGRRKAAPAAKAEVPAEAEVEAPAPRRRRLGRRGRVAETPAEETAPAADTRPESMAAILDELRLSDDE